MASLSDEAMAYLRKLLNESEMPSRETGFRGMRRQVDEAEAERSGGGMSANAESSLKFGQDVMASTHPPVLRNAMESIRAPRDAKSVTGDVSRLAADKNNQLKAGLKGATSLRVPGESPESYNANKMGAIRSAMAEQDPVPQMQGAPELGSAEPMQSRPDASPEYPPADGPPPPGKYGAEGDEWSYEVSGDGTVMVTKAGGEPIKAEPGSRAYNAIVGQIKSGQLKRDTSAFDSAEMMGGGTGLDWEG